MALRQGSTRWRALAPITATVAVAAVCLLGAPAAEAAPCANAEATIDQASGKQLRKAISCVIDKKRVARDRDRLDDNGKLEKAAKRHNETMLDQDCWAHKCNGEPGLSKRVRQTDYPKGSKEWRVAENFGCALTPRGMVNAWLEGDFQRRNMMNPKYEDVGVAAAKRLVSNPPSGCEGDRVTYTVVFAWRKG
jgi:uncharacterized protein YkwD